MTRQRDARGRFAPGNTICHQGWLGLVDKRFDGDETVAKEWLGRIGFHTYARLALEDTPSAYKLEFSTYQYPGSPEEFTAQFGFTLADVPATEF